MALHPENKDAGEHYGHLVTPNHLVVVVGPSISPFIDPTLLWAAARLGEKGRLCVADPQWGEKLSPEDRRAVGAKVGGIAGTGDVTRYLRELNIMRSCGLGLAKPRWLGRESGVHHISLSDNKVDRIIDHHTSVFAASWQQGHAHFLDSVAPLAQTYAEYYRVLNHHGKLLLQTDAADWKTELNGTIVNLQQIIPGLLGQAGFAVEHKTVRDVFTIDFPRNVFRAYSHAPRLTALGPFNHGKLRIAVSHYPSPDLYIAAKN